MASYDAGIKLPNNDEIKNLIDFDVFEDRDEQEEYIIDAWGQFDAICWYALAQLCQEDLNKLHFELEHATNKSELKDAVDYYVGDLI